MKSHLLGCVAESSPCPTPTSHKRLEEAHVFWHRCLDNYQEPEAFRVDLNAGIQALRNVTFALQKEMGGSDGFAEWYAVWQDAMRRTPVMRWIVQARNTIVKQGDLVAESTTRARIVFDYLDVAAIAQERVEESELRSIELGPPVFATLPQIRKIIREKQLPDFMLRDGVIVVERRWVAESLPDSELLTALAYAFAFLSSVVLAADVHFSAASFDPEFDPRTIATEESAYPHRLLPPCMVASHEARTSHYRYLDGSGDVGGIARPIRRDRDGFRSSVEKYGFPAVVRGAESAIDWVEAFAKNAVGILKTGEEHGWFILYFHGGVTVHSEALAARDKADKWALAQHVADMADRLDADGVVQIGEVWIGKMPEDGAPFIPAAEQPGREEAVAVHGATSSGQTKTVLVPFRRSAAFGFVEVGEPTEQEKEQNLFFAALHGVWAARRSGQGGAPEARP